MRIYPPVSVDEALQWLTKEAQDDWALEVTPELERSLQQVAEAMAAVSALVLPEDVEPFAF